MLGGWKVEGVSELSDLILQSGEAPGIFRIAHNVTPVHPCRRGGDFPSPAGSREGAAPIKIGTRWRFPKSCKKWKWNSSHFAHVFRKSCVNSYLSHSEGSPTTNFLFIRGPYPAPPGPPAPA